MAIVTRYHNMAADQLLKEAEGFRSKSELIEELCQRVERNRSAPLPNQGLMPFPPHAKKAPVNTLRPGRI